MYASSAIRTSPDYLVRTSGGRRGPAPTTTSATMRGQISIEAGAAELWQKANGASALPLPGHLDSGGGATRV